MKNFAFLFILVMTTSAVAQVPQQQYQTIELPELDKLEKEAAKPARKPVTRTAVEPKWEYITSVKMLGPLDIYTDRVSIWDDLAYAWIKTVIRQPRKWSAKSRYFRGVNYFLQYATANCKTQRLTRERTTFYNQKNISMEILGDFLVDSTNKPVIPLSVDSLVLDRMCSEIN